MEQGCVPRPRFAGAQGMAGKGNKRLGGEPKRLRDEVRWCCHSAVDGSARLC